jgi:hypothetical protein
VSKKLTASRAFACVAYFLVRKTEAAFSSKASKKFYQKTGHHTPEDYILKKN